MGIAKVNLLFIFWYWLSCVKLYFYRGRVLETWELTKRFLVAGC